MATTTTLGFSILSRYSGGGVRQARTDLASLRAQLAATNGDLQRHTNLLGGIPNRWKAVGGAVATIAPALVPIAASALATTGALTTMAVAVGAALGAYGAAMKGAITRTMEMAAAGKALSPVQKSFVSSVDAMKSAWDKFIKGTTNQTLQPATAVVKGLTAGIALLKPLLDAVHPSVMNVAKSFEAWMKGDQAKNYSALIASLAKQAMPDLVAAGKSVLNVLGDGFRAFAPMVGDLSQKIREGAAALNTWSNGGGFQRFLEYVRANGPAVQQFWVAFRAALSNVLNILKEFAGGSLALLTDALRGIAAINPESVKAFANAFLMLRMPIAWLVLNCPPLRDLIVSLLGAMNPQIIYAVAAAFVVLKLALFAMNAGLIATPVGWVIIALAALAVAIVAIATKTTWFKTAWEYTWNFIKTVGLAIWNALQVAFHAFVNAMVVAWTTVSGALSLAWNTVWNAMSTAVRAVWNALQLAWSAFTMALSTAWTAVSTALTVAWNAVWNAIKLTAETMWNALKVAWNAFITGLQLIWTTVSTALTIAWNAVWNAIKVAAETVWNGLKVAWNAFITGLQLIWTTVSAALSTAWNTVWNAIKVAAESVWNGLKIAWNAFITGLQTIWTTVSTALSTAWSTVWNAIKVAAESVWNGLKIAWNAFITGLQTIWTTVSTALSTAWTTVWNAIKTAAESVWNGLKIAWQAFVSGLQTAWTAVSGALTAAWNAVWTALRTAAQAVWTAMQAAWNAFLNAVRTVWTTISSALSAAWNGVWAAMRTAAQAVWTAMQAAWNAFLTAVRTVWTTVSAALTTAWRATWNAIKTAAEAIWNALKAAWTAFTTALRTAWDTFINAFKVAWKAGWDWVSSTAKKVWDWIGDQWRKITTWIREKWDEWIAAFKIVWKAGWDWVADTAKKVWDWIGDQWKKLTGWIEEVWDTAGDRLKKAWEAIWNWLKDTAAKIWNGIGGVIEGAINGVLHIVRLLGNGFNKVAEFLNIDVKINTGAIDNVKFKTFAAGGIVEFANGGMANLQGGGFIPGYAPGRDTVPAVLSKGEGVLTPEAVRGLGGPSFVNSANRTWAGHRGAGSGPVFDTGRDNYKQFARGGMVGGARMTPCKHEGYANGGMVGGLVPFAVGGMTADALRKAGVSLGLVSQGEYSNGKLSAGTHSGGGVVDISSTSGDMVARLRAAGFAAWARTGSAWAGNEHIHAVLMNHPSLSGPAKAQVASFKSGGNGLGAGGADQGGGGAPSWLEPLIGKAGEIISRVAQGKDISSIVSGLFGGGGNNGDGEKRKSEGFFGTGIGPDVGPDWTPGNDLGDAVGKGVDLAKGYLGSALKMVVPGFGPLGKFLLGLIPDSAFEFGFKWATDLVKDFVPGAGGFGDMMVDVGGKVVKGAIKFLIGKNAEKSAEANARFSGGGTMGDPKQVKAQWGSMAAQALKTAGIDAGQLDRFLSLMAAESGGNPSARNNWDSNAKKGQASQGLMQVIPSTFAAYRDKSLSGNILDPMANMVASARYIKAKYGGRVPGSPYALGTPGATRGIHLVGEQGPELMNFAGGETITPAKETASILTPPAVTPTTMPTDTPVQSPLMEQMANFASAPAAGEGWFGAVISAAEHMLTTTQTAWDGVVQAGNAAQPVVTSVNTTVGDEFGKQIPVNLEAMAAAATANWTAMTTAAQTNWQLQLAEVYTPAETHMGTTMPQMSLAMQVAHDLAWTTMNATSLAQWTLMRDTQYLEFETHLGTTVPAMALAMQTAHDLAWTTMNATSLAQWTLMRDTQYAEFELHMGTTVPAMALAMQTAHDLAWTTMNATSTAQWNAIRDNNIVPFETHMNETMPAAAQAMNTAVTEAFTSMVTAVNEQLDSAIAKIQEFIEATEAAIAAAAALAEAQAAAAASGGGGGTLGAGGGDAAAALASAGVSQGMIVQGPYSNSVSASAGTHSGGGAYDIASTSPSLLAALHAAGFAAWIRAGGSWAGNEHIHAVYASASDLSPQARWQVEDFKRGGSGLGIPGNLAVGTNNARKGWTWVGEQGPELMRMRGGEQVMPHMQSLAFATGWSRGLATLQDDAPQFQSMSARPMTLEREVVRGDDHGCGGTTVLEMPITVQGNLDSEAVDKLESEVLPKLRQLLIKGTGSNS